VEAESIRPECEQKALFTQPWASCTTSQVTHRRILPQVPLVAEAMAEALAEKVGPTPRSIATAQQGTVQKADG